MMTRMLHASWPITAALKLNLEVDEATGLFDVKLDGQPWLHGGVDYVLADKSSSAQTLFLQNAEKSAGTDVFGDYASTTLSWGSSLDGPALMKTSFHIYSEDESVIVFEQEFPSRVLVGPSNSSLSASTIFPSFAKQPVRAGGLPLSCFSYQGSFAGLKSCDQTTYKESLMGGAPLVLYDTSNASLPMTVFSPLDHVMAHHMAHSKDFIGAGVKATVAEIPAGWKQRFLLTASAGINDGMMDWGRRLQTWTGRPLVDNRYLDDTHGAIGFWTDNGGYYHYSIGDNASLGSTYEEVLPKVKAYHDELGVPFKHWQFDSWWYPKETEGAGNTAVTNWTALPEVFPSGVAHMQDLIGLPFILHNRHWSPRSDYVQNWTDIEWYTSEHAAVPKDPVKFFDRFFDQQEGWGLSMYEQDWMNVEYEEVEALQRNISLGDLWLYGMAAGAQKSNRTVQFCMPLPSEVLAASGLPAVTSARASGDYQHGKVQWAIGQTAMFYRALNILPFKDGFYSSNVKQPGGETEGPEHNPDREALIATLSTAMVAPMDGIYLLNKSRVMTTCRADGQVLKPDRPLTPPDACFLRGEPSCFVYSTHSDVKGLGRVHYYYNDDGSAPLLAEEVGLAHEAGKGDFLVYNWYTGETSLLQASNQLMPGYENHTYGIVTPVVKGWALLGEVDKYVTTSTLRFIQTDVQESKLTVTVEGVLNETVRLCAATAPSLEVQCQQVSFDTMRKNIVFTTATLLV